MKNNNQSVLIRIVVLSIVAGAILVLSIRMRSVPPFFKGDLEVARSAAKHQDNSASPPEGWKTLEIKEKIAFHVPGDMKRIQPIGSADWYREAYGNRDINLTIVYGYDIPPAPDRPNPYASFASCDTPRILLEHPAYQESLVEIDGRKAKLGLRREPEFIDAILCVPIGPDSPEPLRFVAYCRNDQALEIVQKIFASIKFREKKVGF